MVWGFGIRMDWELVGARIYFNVVMGGGKLGWRIFGIPRLRGLGVLESLFSRALNDWEVEEAERFLEGFMGRECLEMWMIWWFGPKQRVASSRSSLSTLL
ncbi:hypothetical protein CK203_089074 [Vitis vinifera]|uniref:Uncharacterized protein n=1 Tax=Vitis vinifera TaxID=29760 RepID=A0A438F5V2_VITVI|nr:hypothetical protein CK203_089074 [Vitis vinifera]